MVEKVSLCPSRTSSFTHGIGTAKPHSDLSKLLSSGSDSYSMSCTSCIGGSVALQKRWFSLFCYLSSPFVLPLVVSRVEN